MPSLPLLCRLLLPALLPRSPMGMASNAPVALLTICAMGAKVLAMDATRRETEGSKDIARGGGTAMCSVRREHCKVCRVDSPATQPGMQPEVALRQTPRVLTVIPLHLHSQRALAMHGVARPHLSSVFALAASTARISSAARRKG